MRCYFPAIPLLGEMRRIAREADSSHDPAQIAYAACYVRATNDLRLAHEDITGCDCWYRAIEWMDKRDKLSDEPFHWQGTYS